jgi:hypothetical protein
MKDENEKYLTTTYPKMFPSNDGFWGFECSDGWFTIINMLCRNIQSHLNWKQEIPQVVVKQVKEKFGGLRFYVEGGDEYTNGLISMAEAMSEHTCEVCGHPGETRQGGWIKVLCDDHHAERQAERKARLGEDNDVA